MPVAKLATSVACHPRKTVVIVSQTDSGNIAIKSHLSSGHSTARQYPAKVPQRRAPRVSIRPPAFVRVSL